MNFIILLSYLSINTIMKRDKNLKITQKTHEILKKYCEENGLKMFAYIESLIKRNCKLNEENKDMYGD